MLPSVRQSSHSNTFHPPHGPAPATQWSHTPTAPAQQTVGYNHQQLGMYPPQTTQYPQPYNGYSQDPPTRGAYGSSWDQQRPPAAPMQTTPPQPGGYDYYNQAGFVRNNQPSNLLPGSVPASTPAPMNYGYAPSQTSGVYGNAAPFAQPPPAQQKYGYGYNEPTYDNQPSGPQMYSQQQSIGSQTGSTPYGKPAYGELPPYATARPSQSDEPMYQAAPPAQQPYPYTSNAPTQQAPYNQIYATADGYSQPPRAGGYPQQPAPVYGQGGQAGPAAYGQSVPQSAGYSQYPPSQPSYDQNAQSNGNYGYQGTAPDAAYVGNAPNSGYYAAQQPIGNQLGYAQPPAANPSGYYDQSMPAQPGGYGVSAAPVGYVKSLSPQPGYGG